MTNLRTGYTHYVRIFGVWLDVFPPFHSVMRPTHNTWDVFCCDYSLMKINCEKSFLLTGCHFLNTFDLFVNSFFHGCHFVVWESPPAAQRSQGHWRAEVVLQILRPRKRLVQEGPGLSRRRIQNPTFTAHKCGGSAEELAENRNEENGAWWLHPPACCVDQCVLVRAPKSMKGQK